MRIPLTLTLASASLIVAGCASEAPEPVVEEVTSTVTSTTTVPPFEPDDPVEKDDAFTFSAGKYELGPLEGEAELFNACESLTSAELKKLDLEVAGDVDQTQTTLSCPMIKGGDSAVAYVVTSIAGSRATVGEFDESLRITELKASTSVPNLYLGQYGGQPPMCGAFVDTTSGILSVNVVDTRAEMPVGKQCERAQKTLESLYKIGK
ncbi:DUF3558 family protein [Corynebacterium qintianiae]|uniref:DUF3558 family protein n=1 Tax=Corynebacterium qintianiae TaxID=2709392 RepID=A0A7T0KPX9_9CORY|nr:DUF3558 family protein [Corynebacterium qintianiae]QPK83868.1 DUF3558 family protein [Corynebacterium qintianiae]